MVEILWNQFHDNDCNHRHPKLIESFDQINRYQKKKGNLTFKNRYPLFLTFSSYLSPLTIKMRPKSLKFFIPR